MARRGRSRLEREARFREMRERIQMDRGGYGGAPAHMPPSGDGGRNWGETPAPPQEHAMRHPDETRPVFTPQHAQAPSDPRMAPQMPSEPRYRFDHREEEVPPELPPEPPVTEAPRRPTIPEQAPLTPEPPVRDTYEEDLREAREREQLAREAEARLEESFQESDQWWDTWNRELDQLMDEDV